MSKGRAIVLGFFTCWPFLYMLMFMGFIGWTMMRDVTGSAPSSGLPAAFMIIFALHLLTMLEILILLVIYIVHLFRSDRVPNDKKALWAVVLFLGNLIAMPVYWYLYIWRKP